ncbi:tRNA pseudouridine synthase A [Arthrospiribacter ruber]|uniref:tRNA pseudouridine synthase A n=1 Tax=Arthrospiribacter ruber TaxID=2487934 RepID=A0A951J2I5_9BACT|nr:tRNA pseudouridine synthase A [Arthrospiribacter ruber]MBW3470107.1 tRNA pseudouridine synthase A [Arthrospiribacter ruber]
MNTKKNCYLLYIQYLGLRYSGWQRQKGVKTIQGTLERGIRYVLGHEDFNVLGASRTDAGVSCRKGAFELFLKEPLPNIDFLTLLNQNLPTDIKVLELQPIGLEFNIIQDVESKTYAYTFVFGEKPDPLENPTAGYFPGMPDVDLMKAGAAKLVGKFDFRRFCSVDKVTIDFVREVSAAELVQDASIRDTKSTTLVFIVSGKGFLRYQVRIMAGALADLGLGKLTLEDFENALIQTEGSPVAIAAPACGLVLEQVRFLEEKLK